LTAPEGQAPGPAGAAEGLRSALLAAAGFRHAFFTRRGGVSEPPWASLSFAVSTGDAPEAVRENLARAASLLGVPAARVYFLSQVHGTACHALQGEEDRAEVVRWVGDALVSRTTGVACGVRTADCAPVLVADRRSGGVAAIHSGWRGTEADIAGAGVRALRALAGGEPDLVAAVGPHIERCCFEVGEDVAKRLAGCSAAGETAVSRTEGRKPRVDLRMILRAQLAAAGVTEVEDVPGCTVCDRERFHSFRRDGQVSGRMLSAIVAGGAGARMG
jgi:polyphenol oxidase